MHKPSLEQLLGMSAQQFLDEYWQKKPCVIRQAWPLKESPISGDELAGLACEVENAARIVQEHHKDGPWNLSYGPFDEKAFAALPESHWTLLVSDCEKFIPELQDFVEPFRFIPDWRIDDLMISYAVEGGSVGPHVDEYDVFLLQLEGTREWQVGPLADPQDCVPGLQLQILNSFTPDNVYLMEPGDLLYLPPRYSHYGIGRGESCMTASVGFRAPEPKDLMHAWVDEVGEQISDNAPLKDTPLQVQKNPGEIKQEHIAALREEILSRVTGNSEQFQSWLGEYLTEPKHAEAGQFEHAPEEDEIDTAVALLHGRQTALVKNPFSNLAYIQTENNILLFADGHHWKLPLHCLEDVQQITAAPGFIPAKLQHLNDTALFHCLTALLLAEVLFPDDEEFD